MTPTCIWCRFTRRTSATWRARRFESVCKPLQDNLRRSKEWGAALSKEYGYGETYVHPDDARELHDTIADVLAKESLSAAAVRRLRGALETAAQLVEDVCGEADQG